MKKAKNPPKKAAVLAQTTPTVQATRSAAPPVLAAVGLCLLFVHLALSPVLFTRPTVEVFEYPKVLLLLLTAILLGTLGVWRGLAWRSERWWRPVSGPADTQGAGVPRQVRTPDATSITPRSCVQALWHNPIPLGVCLFLLSAAASTVTSISPLTSWQGAPESYGGLQTLLAGGVLFIATSYLGRRPAAARLLLAAVVPGAAVSAAYALLQFFRIDPVSWSAVSNIGTYDRPFGTIGHANFLAAYQVMSLPITLFFAHRAWRRGRRALVCLLGAVALASLTVIALSLSRGAWLALAGSGGFALLVLVASARWRRRLVLPGLALVVLGSAAVAGVASLGQEGLPRLVQERAQQLLHSPSRLDLWEAGLSMFRERPWFGVGLDTFGLAHGLHRTPDCWRQEWGTTPTRAHNEIIHILATQGLVGLCALLVLVGGLVVTGYRVWRCSPGHRPLLLAVFAGLTGFAIQDLFGFTVAPCGTLFLTLAALLACWSQLPGEEAAETVATDQSLLLPGLLAFNLLVGGLCWLNFHVTLADKGSHVWPATVVLLLAAGGTSWALVCLECPRSWLLVRAWRGVFPFGRLRQLSRRAALCLVLQVLVLAGALGLLEVLVLRPCRANLLCQAGLVLLPEQPEPAVAVLTQAVALDRNQDLYWTRLGQAAQVAAAAAPSPGQQVELLDVARTSLEEAVRLVPASSYNKHNLGLVLARLARTGRVPSPVAFQMLDEALALDPYNALFYGDAANVALGLGERERARAYAARGVAVEPQFGRCLAQLGYLAVQEQQYREGRRLLQAAMQTTWQDNPEGEATVAWVNLALAEYHLGLFEEAGTAARRALRDAPQLVEMRFLLADCLERLGVPAAAVRQYHEILRQRPDHAGARQALRRLQ